MYVLTGASLAAAQSPGFVPSISDQLFNLGDNTWGGFVPGLGEGDSYRFWVVGKAAFGLKRDVDGVRLLRPETLARMMTNQLTDAQRANSVLLGQKPFAVGRGFGLGLSVVLETDPNDMMRRGGVGTVSWPGGFGGFWQADPNDGSVLIFLAHNMVDLAQMAKGIGLDVWAAVEAFQKSAADSQV